MPRIGPVSLAELPKVARSGWDREIARVAARQHGLITLAQLAGVGLGASAVAGRVAAGRLHRVHRGVYAVGRPPLTSHAHFLAAVLACGPGAALSHLSAGALWRIRASAAALIDVTAPHRAGRSRHGIRVHRGDRLPAEETTMAAGIPCTTVARTLIDLAAVLPADAAEYAIHRAQSRRLLRRAEVIEAIDRSPTRRGTALVRRALGVRNVPEDDVQSWLERRFLAICRRAGFPLPRSNYFVALPGGGGLEVDFAWPDRRLVVETDSRAYHETHRAFENDPRRDRALVAAGWRVVRFTYRDVTERPAAVTAELRRLLAL